MTVLRAALASVVFLAVVPNAHAGTLSAQLPESLTYVGSDRESVNVGIEASVAVITTDQTITYAPGTALGCTFPEPDRAECGPPHKFVVRLNGLSGSSVDGRPVTGVAFVDVEGGPGGDRIDGSANGDVLKGMAGNDTISGGDGDDRIEAGDGGGEIDDGPGNDDIIGGSGGDNWTAGPGSDRFTPGDGSDSVSYAGRSNSVTITLDGVADDGEAGEGDNVGPAEDAIGGAGNDRIVGNDFGGRLNGGPGNDTIVGGRAEDYFGGNEGDDVIDSRDGRYDTVDCGPGNDVVYADPGDSTTGCEVAPDVDGDGYLPPADCNPTDPAIHPNAGEIIGNNVDEDCAGGPGYLRVVSPASFSTERDQKRSRARFVKFTLSEVKSGDKIEIRCKSKSKGCAFTSKAITGKSKRSINILSYFKKQYLKKGAVVEVRVTRANEIGSVRRLTIQKGGNIKLELLCLSPGATTPARCA